MTEPTELLPCPFCGAAAHFEMDDGCWEWVECESCGMQGNRSASLMEDCKPKLAEEWNRRTPQPHPGPTQAGAVPLTDEQIRAMAREHPAEDLCGWSYRMGIADTERHHGIKGGQHGAE